MSAPPIGPGGAVAEPRHSRTRPHPNPAEDSTRHTDPAPPPLARKAQCTYRCVVLPDRAAWKDVMKG